MCRMLIERVLRLDLGTTTQAFVNLLSNAVKFTPPGGSIDIDSDLTPDGCLVIWIRDTGQGIPPDELDRGLQPFGQLEDHLTRENAGLALGRPFDLSPVARHRG